MNIIFKSALAVFTLAGLLLSGCGSSGGGSDDNEEATTSVDGGQVLPTCTITQGVPLTDSQITVHVVCKDGNVEITDATVTVDGQVKYVNFSGSSINDYIGFRNLQDDTVYTVNLEAIIDGNVFTKSVKIRTDDIPVEPAPSPAPTNNQPTCDNFTNTTSSSDATGPLVPHMHDTDAGDTLTANYVGHGVLSGNLVIQADKTRIANNEYQIQINAPQQIQYSGIAYIDYTVSDDSGQSNDTSTTCRITFTSLQNDLK